MQPRRLPERSCVACRTPRPKPELVRVVRTPTGLVTIDPTGRLPGRGAYLCRDAACWDTAGRKHALERALKSTIPADVAAALAVGPYGPEAVAAGVLEHDLNEGGAHGQE